MPKKFKILKSTLLLATLLTAHLQADNLLEQSNSNWDWRVEKSVVKKESKENPKQLLVDDILKQVKNNSAFHELDDDEKDYLIMELSLKIKRYDRESVNNLLLEYDYSNDFAKKESDKIPTKLARTPDVTIEELKNLATLSFKDVIDDYVKTWKIPKWFESFEKGLKEIKTIIKNTEAIIRRWVEADKRWEEADRKAKKAKEIEEKMNWLIKEMEKIKKSSWII